MDEETESMNILKHSAQFQIWLLLKSQLHHELHTAQKHMFGDLMEGVGGVEQ